ncbi:ketopantoate reductase family protein [Pallidibacillus thermolactis]|jgi:2-dehydropantoate 2-reductase|uniref:ketopantoate reductase family protein n=1 Tax=Pallidibacillus thermolactis TaxID=251051 RepID=UPI0021D914D4|nr:2-dehydropantoate 2-reductase [Pallidibacillus thermolactis]MCU9601928.1 2-dehydropantoate 2-reductase [Pallidibacillus thermolactis subsp. kokeshiiformis]
MRMAIMGVGSLGIIIGALITEGKQNVDLIDANRENVKALNENGAQITGIIEKNVKVNALTPEQIKGEYDLVFLLTKQVYNEKALNQLLPHLHENSVVCTLQNGVPEDKVSSIVGKNRTIGGAVGFGATWLRPGVSELTTKWSIVQKYAFDIGELNGEITTRVQKIAEILNLVGHCKVSDHILGIKWAKLLMNSTFSGMSAALGCTFGDVLYNEKAMYSLACIADETIKVAHGLGITLPPMQGKDFEFLELKDESDIPNKMDFYKEVWNPHVNLKASMLQDLEKRKKTEIDYINGYVSAKGKLVGVKTPYNDLVVKLVKQAEEQKVVPDFFVNIDKFERLKNNGTNYGIAK